MFVTGVSPDGKLPEIVEIKKHPRFLACQFHPEFKSRPLVPHPLFVHFIEAAKEFGAQKKWAGLKQQTALTVVEDKKLDDKKVG
ncbi:MAG: CTP synthetase [uncultured bacterium]|nr:MAG: CTP synthetase [uncultured bacterium]